MQVLTEHILLEWSFQWWHQLGLLLHPQVSWQDCRAPTPYSKLLCLPSGMVHFVHFPQKDGSLYKQMGCTLQHTICSSCPLCADIVLFLKPFKISCRLKKHPPHPLKKKNTTTNQTKNKYRWTLVYNTDGNEIQSCRKCQWLIIHERDGKYILSSPKAF